MSTPTIKVDDEELHQLKQDILASLNIHVNGQLLAVSHRLTVDQANEVREYLRENARFW